MPLIERTEAQILLNSHIHVISASISQGVSEYFSMYSDVARSRHRPTTRANIIHDHIIDNAKRRFSDPEKVRYRESHGLSLFMLDQKFLLRFKKLTEEKVSRNQKTNQVQAFRQQQQVLDGIPSLHNIEAGYVFNELEQRIQDMYLVYPNGPGIYWDINLEDVTMPSSVVDIFSQDESEATGTTFVARQEQSEQQKKVVTLKQRKDE